MNGHEGLAILRALLGTEQLATVQNLKWKDRRHPLQRLLFPQDRDEQFVYNTGGALSAISDRDERWLLAKKRQLLSVDSYNNASSVLGEARAYGSLLRCGLAVKPGSEGKGSEPDFLVEGEVFVEVHAKQPEPDEALALEHHHAARFRTTPGEGVSVRMHFYTPFGAPKPGESVTRNAIQKLAQIKQKEEAKQQFSDTAPSILWLDFQDDAWSMIISAYDSIPVVSWHGGFYSRPLWYALYGWKGAPVFQGETTEPGARRPLDEMRHDGRFRQNTKVDAVIASFPKDTIILENPFSRKPIQAPLWSRLMLLPDFNLGLSHINWPQDDLSLRIESQKTSLEALAREAIYSW